MSWGPSLQNIICRSYVCLYSYETMFLLCSSAGPDFIKTIDKINYDKINGEKSRRNIIV